MRIRQSLIIRLQTKDTKPTMTMKCLKTRSRQRAVQIVVKLCRESNKSSRSRSGSLRLSDREGAKTARRKRPHGGAHDGNRDRTVGREHLMRRLQFQGSTRRADSSISTSCLCREVPTDHEAHGRSSGSRCRRAEAQLQSSAQESK